MSKRRQKQPHFTGTGELPPDAERSRIADAVHRTLAAIQNSDDGFGLCHYYAEVGVKVMNALLGEERYQIQGGSLAFGSISGYVGSVQHAWIIATHQPRGSSLVPGGTRIEMVDLASRHYSRYAAVHAPGALLSPAEVPPFVWGWEDELPRWTCRRYPNDDSLSELRKMMGKRHNQQNVATLARVTLTLLGYYPDACDPVIAEWLELVEKKPSLEAVESDSTETWDKVD